jgi:hypothetical protein
MRRTRVALDLPGSVGEAEALWYDVERWPAFVDGFAHVVSRDGAWPAAGATLVWDSLPHGRGRVVERVVEHVAGQGQTAEIEDPRLRGTQTVAFEALDDGVGVSLALEYALQQGGPLKAVIDALFIRRAIRDSLRRTLVRFGSELQSDGEPLRQHGSR